jgi:hypothetical protein
MATPYGHTLVGLTLFHIFQPDPSLARKRCWIAYGLVILGAGAPDLDFIPGLFFLDPGKFHHGLWHSLGAAVLFSPMAGFLVHRLLPTSSFLRTTGFVFLLFSSHLLLDFFTEDPLPPYGFPFFWPVHKALCLSPVSLFPYVLRHPDHRDFWGHSFLSLAVESFLLLPFFILTLRKKDPAPPPPGGKSITAFLPKND